MKIIIVAHHQQNEAPATNSILESEDLEVFRSFFAAVRHDLVFDLLTLIQTSQACLFDSGDVHEHILAACLRLNKVETVVP